MWLSEYDLGEDVMKFKPISDGVIASYLMIYSNGDLRMQTCPQFRQLSPRSRSNRETKIQVFSPVDSSTLSLNTTLLGGKGIWLHEICRKLQPKFEDMESVRVSETAETMRLLDKATAQLVGQPTLYLPIVDGTKCATSPHPQTHNRWRIDARPRIQKMK